jgi:hypothetical protein
MTHVATFKTFLVKYTRRCAVGCLADHRALFTVELGNHMCRRTGQYEWGYFHACRPQVSNVFRKLKMMTKMIIKKWQQTKYETIISNKIDRYIKR